MTETLSTKDGQKLPSDRRMTASTSAIAIQERPLTFGASGSIRISGTQSLYPGSVRKNKTFAATFAGERIALYRGESGTVYALEDRCAHRQVPLSMGVVEGDVLRCCYHAWAYRGNGRISQIPYLPKGADRPPRGVRAYPAREAYGLVFVFPGDPQKAAATSTTGAAGVRFHQAQDDDVLPYRPLPLLVHARESP